MSGLWPSVIFQGTVGKDNHRPNLRVRSTSAARICFKLWWVWTHRHWVGSAKRHSVLSKRKMTQKYWWQLCSLPCLSFLSELQKSGSIIRWLKITTTLFLFFCDRVSLYFWSLSWNQAGFELTACLCLLSAGIKVVRLHRQAYKKKKNFFLKPQKLL